MLHTLNPRGKKPVDYGLIEAMTITATAFWLEGVRDLARAAVKQALAELEKFKCYHSFS